MRVMLRKSVADEICRYWGFPLVKAYNPRDPKFEYFKRKIIAHLDKLERQEAQKSLAYFERLEKARHATYNIGETATWKGKKYIKGADKKWRRYYEGHSKQAESTITRLKGQARKCANSSELWDLVANNWGRFMDTDGMPLALVREFHQYVSTIEDEINAGVAVENRTAHRPKRKRNPSGAKRTANEGGVSDSTTDIAKIGTSRKNDTATLANTTSSSIPQSAENASKIKEQYEDALREYKKADENFFKTAAAVDYTLPPAVITDRLWVDVVDPDYKNFVKDSEKALEAAARQLREDEEAAQQLPRAEKRKKRDEFMQRAKDWHKRREDFAAKRKEREQKIIRDYLNTREYKAARWYLERMGIPFRESGFCHPWRSDALKPARSNLSRARYLLWNAQSAAEDAGINVDEYYYRTKASNLTESELMKKVVQDFENATRAQDSSSHDTQKSLPPHFMYENPLRGRSCGRNRGRTR